MNLFEAVRELGVNMAEMPEDFLKRIEGDVAVLFEYQRHRDGKEWDVSIQCVMATDLCHTIPRLIAVIRELRQKTTQGDSE